MACTHRSLRSTGSIPSLVLHVVTVLVQFPSLEELTLTAPLSIMVPSKEVGSLMRPAPALCPQVKAADVCTDTVATMLPTNLYPVALRHPTAQLCVGFAFILNE